MYITSPTFLNAICARNGHIDLGLLDLPKFSKRLSGRATGRIDLGGWCVIYNFVMLHIFRNKPRAFLEQNSRKCKVAGDKDTEFPIFCFNSDLLQIGIRESGRPDHHGPKVAHCLLHIFFNSKRRSVVDKYLTIG